MPTTTRYFEPEKKRQNRRHLIVVEGNDDALFVSEILDSIDADEEKIGILDVGGNANFASFLSSYSKSPGFSQGLNKSLSIICDADDDCKKTVDGMKLNLSSLKIKNISVGGFTTGEQIIFGLFVFPDCSKNGDLERLCLDTVEGAPLRSEAENFINLAEKSEGALNGSRYKRIAQVYLAGMRKGLVRGAGHGFKDGYFDKSHDALKPLIVFLEKIKNLD